MTKTRALTNFLKGQDYVLLSGMWNTSGLFLYSLDVIAYYSYVDDVNFVDYNPFYVVIS